MITLTPLRTPGTIVYHLSAAGRVPLCGDTVTGDALRGWEARGEQRPGAPVSLCTRCKVRADLLISDGEELVEDTDLSRDSGSSEEERARRRQHRRAAVLAIVEAEMNRTDDNDIEPSIEMYLDDVARCLLTIVEDTP